MCASSIAVRSENGMSREDLLNDRDTEEVDPEAAAADDYGLDEGEHEASAHHASAPVPEAKENEPVGAEGLDLSDAVTFSPEGQGQGDRHLIPATQDFPLTQPEADESAEMAEESGVGIGNEPEDIDGTEVPQDEVLEEAPEMSAASEPYLMPSQLREREDQMLLHWDKVLELARIKLEAKSMRLEPFVLLVCVLVLCCAIHLLSVPIEAKNATPLLEVRFLRAFMNVKDGPATIPQQRRPGGSGKRGILCW